MMMTVRMFTLTGVISWTWDDSLGAYNIDSRELCIDEVMNHDAETIAVL